MNGNSISKVSEERGEAWIGLSALGVLARAFTQAVGLGWDEGDSMSSGAESGHGEMNWLEE